MSPWWYKNKCFLVALSRLIVTRPALAVASKKLLHQQKKTTGVVLVPYCTWKSVPTAFSGGVNLSNVPRSHFLGYISSQWRSQKLLQSLMYHELTVYLSDLDLFLAQWNGHISKRTTRTTLSSLALLIFEVVVPILLNVNFSLNQSLLTFLLYWYKLGWLNSFCQFVCERFPSFNSNRVYYSYARSYSLHERRTSFCTGSISRKFSGFLFMFSTGFTSFFVLLLFLPSIILSLETLMSIIRTV